MRGKPIRPQGAMLLKLLAIAFCTLLLAACSDMKAQPRYDPLEASSFFPDDRSARPLVTGVVPREVDPAQEAALSGRGPDGRLVETFPITITLNVLKRGQERYNIFCSPCHGLDGYGQGMIVQRGFPTPPSFHTDRLRQAPVGHFYDVITNGFGVMYAYDYRIKPLDRWAIVAYIRALQLSQNASTQDIPINELQKLQGEQP